MNKLAKVEVFSFLGVEKQGNLKWNMHIKSKANKISKINSFFYRLKHIIPEKTMLHIYNALIVPPMTYGIAAWGSATTSLLNRIAVLQKKCLRTISNSKFNSHTKPIFRKYNLLKFQDIYRINCCKLCYRAKMRNLPVYHSEQLKFIGNINPYSSRQSLDIYIPHLTSSIQKHKLSYTLGSNWNKLPVNLKQINNVSVNCFTRKVKNFIISSYSKVCTVRNCYSCRK